MKLSRDAPSAERRSPSKPVSRPDGSRVTVNTGCTTRRTSTPRSASSPITESSRNGMSSLTISITEMWRSSSLAPAGRHRDPQLRRAGVALGEEAQADSASAAISRPS